MTKSSILVFLSALVASSYGYSLDGESQITLSLEDTRTGISPISTLFLGEKATVVAEGLSWVGTSEGDTTLKYETRLNGETVASGTIDLPEDPLDLPIAIQAGEVYTSTTGSTFIEVQLSVGNTREYTSTNVQSIKKWTAAMPVIIGLGLPFINIGVGYSLLTGLFVGACLVSGSVVDGFVSMTTTYILDAVSAASHGYM